jgi:hypothetical protein
MEARRAPGVGQAAGDDEGRQVSEIAEAVIGVVAFAGLLVLIAPDHLIAIIRALKERRR